MKRMHVHVSVRDLEASIRFYSQLFAVAPSVVEPDYAKWMLDDPLLNFAISQRDRPAGVEHLGIQVSDRAELDEVYERLRKADRPVLEEGETVCCYAHSEKSWIEDPQGVRWETFLTMGRSTVYGHDAPLPAGTCCVPTQTEAEAQGAACCTSDAQARRKTIGAPCCD